MSSTTTVSPAEISFEDTSIAFASKTNAQLKKTYWIFSLMNQRVLVGVGTFFIKLGLLLRLPIKSIIKNTVFLQFCGGETIVDCKKAIKTLSNGHIGTILDYSVEGEGDEKSFEATASEILRSIEFAAANSTDVPFSVFKVTGVCSVELLEKIQNEPHLLTEDEKKQFTKAEARLNQIFEKAASLNVRIFVDAEESWIQDVIDDLAYKAMKVYNKKEAIVYNTLQFYRRDMLDNLKAADKDARTEGYHLGVKLVRGAYFERERFRALENEYCDPIHATKADTDQCFDAGLAYCLEHLAEISICLGTHNEQSCLMCVDLMHKMDIDQNDSRIWFAQLLGMSDNISYNLSNAGYNVAKYVPYGPVEAVMPYLFRRAEENKSIAGQSSREYLLVKKEVERRKNIK